MNGGALGCCLDYGKDRMSPVVHHPPGCPLTLADTELQDEEGTRMAKLFISIHGNSSKIEDPSSTGLDWQGETFTRPNITAHVNPNSWLIFQL